MSQQWWKMDLESLKERYTQESQELADALVQGLEWEQLSEKIKLVTQLSIVIDRKMEGFPDPAANANR